MTDVSKCRALFLAGNALHRCEHAAGGASQRLLRNRPPCICKTSLLYGYFHVYEGVARSRTVSCNLEARCKRAAFWTREDGFYCERAGVSHAGKTFHTLRKQKGAPLYAIDNALTTETALNKTWNIRNMYKDIVLFAQLRRKVQAADQKWAFWLVVLQRSLHQIPHHYLACTRCRYPLKVLDWRRASEPRISS